MNSQHHIDSAIFNTTYSRHAVTKSQQKDLNLFIKDSLPRVIDEVFNDPTLSAVLDHNHFKLDKLEIDLGAISFREYRQKMPGMLREKLTNELGKLRAEVSSDAPLSSTGANDLTRLFFFLEHGYLPGPASRPSTAELQSIFAKAVESPLMLDFIDRNKTNQQITERLEKQFGVTALPVIPAMPGRGYQADLINDLHFDLVSALSTADIKLIRKSWNTLFKIDQQRLKIILNFYGQQQDIQNTIVSSFTTPMFNQLIQLLVPTDYEFTQALIANASELLSRSLKVKAQSLNYLLADNSPDVDRQLYFAGLLTEWIKLSGADETEWLNRLHETLKQTASQKNFAEKFQTIVNHLSREEPVPDRSDIETELKPYQHFENLKQVLSNIRAISTPGLIDDIQILTNDYPWLLIRLYRELKTDTHIQFNTLPSGVLTALIESFLNLNPLSTSTPLYRAIQENAAKSTNKPLFLARVLDDLIQGEIINFVTIQAEIKSNHNPPLNAHAEQSESRPLPIIDNRKQASDTISNSFKLNRPITSSQQQSLIQAISYLAQRDSQALQDLLRASLLNHGIKQITGHFPESVLRTVLSAINLSDAPAILQSIELLNTAALSLKKSKTVNQLQKLKWYFIFQQATESAYQTNRHQLALRYINALIELTGESDTRAYLALITQSLLKNSLPSTRSQSSWLISLLVDTIEAIPEFPRRTSSKAVIEDKEPHSQENIYIENAGIVLVAPYFPVLFKRLEYTNDHGFKSRELAERALHCIQFLVDNSTSSPEYQLVLNKFLCGIKTGIPIEKSIKLTTQEIDQLEGLLLEVTHRWKPLNNTSIDGLRESFLQRNGRLQRKDDAWYLNVENKPWDMLLDSIPWSYSIIKFRWMKQVIYVEWR